jgi:D-inositol-3-phosphate glycosyltransferase
VPDTITPASSGFDRYGLASQAALPITRTLLVIGLYSPGSGLTTVLSRLVEGVSPRYDIHYIGLTPYEAAPAAPPADSPFRLYIEACRSPLALSPGRAILNRYMARLRPAAVLVAGPAAMIDSALRCLQPWRGAARIIAYVPIEGEAVGPAPLRTIALADACILYTRSARRNVMALHRHAAAAGSGETLPRLFVVGHGVDPLAFSPIGGSVEGHFGPDGRAAARRMLFADEKLHGGFIVLNANRCWHRKRLDLSIAGFARFAAARPQALLYLHVPEIAAAERADLENAAAAAGVGGRVFINLLNPDGALLPRARLNLLYNACDVGLTTAMGEGWGLGTFEHAATGAPQIVPSHTSFIEIWRGAALLVPVVARQHVFYEFADMFAVSPSGVAQALEQIYTDPALRRRLAQAAFARATGRRFQWQYLAARLEAVLDIVMRSPEPGSSAESH